MSSSRAIEGCVLATGTGWETVLADLRPETLDCFQTTLALIANRAYGNDAHLALGCRFRLPVRLDDGTIKARPDAPDRLEEGRALLGFRLGPLHQLADDVTLRRLLDRGDRVYVVADAYRLMWLPFAGRRHMAHSFLLERYGDAYTVIDAYHNDTEWGPAIPGAWRLSADGLRDAVNGGATAVVVHPGQEPPAIDRSAVMRDNAERARNSAPGIDGYANAARGRLGRLEAAEDLVLDIWLLARERLLHARWLGDHPAAAEVLSQAHRWQALAAQSYLGLRRAQRGGQLGGAVIEDAARLLHDDAALAARIGRLPVRDLDHVTTIVLEVLSRTLGVDDQAIRLAGTLRTLPGFNSFRLVDVIDQVEQRLGVALTTEIAAAHIQDVSGLCRLFLSAMADRPGS